MRWKQQEGTNKQKKSFYCIRKINVWCNVPLKVFAVPNAVNVWFVIIIEAA
jgi:hypothetical protein